MHKFALRREISREIWKYIFIDVLRKLKIWGKIEWKVYFLIYDFSSFKL